MLHCSIATLFRSWFASLAVWLRTLVSQVRAQRHSRKACHIVFWHREIVGKKQLKKKKKKILDFENAWSPSWIFFKIQKKNFLFFFWNFFFLKYRHSAEEKIEPIFRFFRFLFFELWPFLCHSFEKSVNFRGKKIGPLERILQCFKID